MNTFEHCLTHKVTEDERCARDARMRASALALLAGFLAIPIVGCSSGPAAGEATSTTQAALSSAAASPHAPVAGFANAAGVVKATPASGSPNKAGSGQPRTLVENAVAIGAGSAPSSGAGSAPPSSSPSAADDASPEQLEAWRTGLQTLDAPHDGCFTAEYPSTTWVVVPCATPPNTPRPHPKMASGSPDLVGNGNDYVITAPSSTKIATAQGSFPTVSGVTSLADFSPNNFSFQINSNTFTGPTTALTALCMSGNNSSTCGGWEQFIWSNTQSDPGEGVGATTLAFIQYWLLNYNSGVGTNKSCPTGWNAAGLNCWRNDPNAFETVGGGAQSITNLAQLQLGASATSSSDKVTAFVNGTAYAISSRSSVLGLSQVWNQAEFNIVGNGNGSEDCFNQGSSVNVKTAITTSPATSTGAGCVSSSGTTGETNNLTLGSCSVTNNSAQFTQNSAQLCMPGNGTYWPTAYQSNTNGLNIQATSNNNMGNFIYFTEGLSMQSTTVPSYAMLASAGSTSPALAVAFQDNTGHLYLEETTVNGGTILSEASQNLAMAASTSPSVATTWNTGAAPEGVTGIGLVGYQTSDGNPIIAFQGSNTDLWLEVVGIGWDQGLTMAPQSSPSMVMFPPSSPNNGQGITVFQNSVNSLMILQGSYDYNLGLAVAPFTSPSVAINPSGGYDIAFQGSNNHLFFVTVPNPPNNGGTLNFNWTDEGLGMFAGSSPSLTTLSNGTPFWAFQANTGNLYVQNTNQNLGMASEASPTILPTPFGWQVAFEANTGNLWLDVGNSGASTTGVGINIGLPMNSR